MLINMKVFCKLIILFLMGLARHAQMVLINLQYLCDILRKKPIMKLVLNCTDWFNTTLTIYHWPCSSLNMKPIPSIFLILLIVFGTTSLIQIMVGPCKLTCFSEFIKVTKKQSKHQFPNIWRYFLLSQDIGHILWNFLLSNMKYEHAFSQIFLVGVPTSIYHFFCLHLSLSIHLSIHLSVAHHSSWSIHHVIIIFGTCV